MPRELFTLSNEAFGMLGQAFGGPGVKDSPMAAFASATGFTPEITPVSASKPAPSA